MNQFDRALVARGAKVRYRFNPGCAPLLALAALALWGCL